MWEHVRDSSNAKSSLQTWAEPFVFKLLLQKVFINFVSDLNRRDRLSRAIANARERKAGLALASSSQSTVSTIPLTSSHILTSR